MATLVLSAAGAALGGAVGGAALGVSSVAIGRFAGALLGNALDQRILGQGAEARETGRIDRLRLNSASEGRAIPRVYGRMRVGGQVIWATQFQEHVLQSGGGKGGSGAGVRSYSYTLSLALALCEGEITGVSRIWADGVEIAPVGLTLRVYKGDQAQLPDAKMEAVEGAGLVPAYRGTAYVVIEDLDLTQFGNRVPQFSFEIARAAPVDQAGAQSDPTYGTSAVALIPGTGEYALATEPVYYLYSAAEQEAANLNAPSGLTDFETAVAGLQVDLPNCEAVSLIVSWFGTDLRCADCAILPRPEKLDADGSMPWQVAGLARDQAVAVPSVEGRPVYGGTPSDDSILQAIRHLTAQGKAVMFYPFILMEQLANNGLPDPWSDAPDQPVLPWRGRITLSEAPGRSGSPDGTALAEAEVAAFFGTAAASDFTVSPEGVQYSGPEGWTYRRFILHQAALCAAAGGVERFCIGSEMRSLTWIRGADGEFPAVTQLQALAAEARALLGPDVLISYAADWSEYFGYQPSDGSGDRFFHLDPLWADDEIDFIGIDNYMPLSDWREGEDHADAHWGEIYDLDYLAANIEGGEGYEWYYHSPEAADAQIRTPITDGGYNEPWVYRYKDIRNWWGNAHYNRIGGIRQDDPTAWVPQSKPIVFTELGCAAVDKATNEPNKFIDPKSSESTLPKYSSGLGDAYIQHQYLKAMYRYWGEETHNPMSALYEGRMIDMARAYVWAWDSRPYPRFPLNQTLWADGANYDKGHWISGRSTHRSLASVVQEICERAGATEVDVSGLTGLVSGYSVDHLGDARAALQPLMLRYGFDAVEQDGKLLFQMRGTQEITPLDPDGLALSEDTPEGIKHHRAAEAETVARVRITAIEAMGDYDTLSEEAALSDETDASVTTTELNLALRRGEARQVAERWLEEAKIAKDSLQFALPLSGLALGAGDVVTVSPDGGEAQAYRIDRVEQTDRLQYEAVRIEPSLYTPSEIEEDPARLEDYVAPLPVVPLFMDLPLLNGDEDPIAPHLAIATSIWPGNIAVYDSADGDSFALNTTITQRAVVGLLQNDLPAAASDVFDLGAGLEVRLLSGSLSSTDEAGLLNGANLAAIGDGTAEGWEIIQFQQAELIGENLYRLSKRLRGKAGTDALGFAGWPKGSWFVLLDAAVPQITLAAQHRDTQRSYRVGPANLPMDHASFVGAQHRFAGNGLRPYAPVHLRATLQGADIALTWTRQTRIDGALWLGPEVPLGEESEAYVVEIAQGQTLLRQNIVAQASWTYSAAQQIADGAAGLIEIRVAQVSARYGAGASAHLIWAI